MPAQRIMKYPLLLSRIYKHTPKKNEDKTDYEVDALAGATITGDGLASMLRKDVQKYVPFFKSLKN